MEIGYNTCIMPRYSIEFFINEGEEGNYIPSLLDGVVDFDKNDPFELKLIEILRQPEYMRMARIPQLGFVEHSIPTANHSRLMHQIDATDLMRELIVWSNRNYGKTRAKAWDFNLKEQAAIAAPFMHDIGHAFPGHPFERAIKDMVKKGMFKSEYKNHEKWGIEIIQRSNIYNILNSYSAGFADKVLDVLSEDNMENSIWQQIESGNLNIDTFAYLQRDQQQTKPAGEYNKYRAHRIIENVKFGTTPSGGHCVILKPEFQTHFHFMKMLEIRGEMYSDVYFNGVPASAEAFLGKFFEEIYKATDSGKLESDNPFVKFIESEGTDYGAYLYLTADAFYNLVDELSKLNIPGLSDIARNYKNIRANFSAVEIYKGDADHAPSDAEIQAKKEDVESRGGVFRDVPVPLYDMKKPEVYCIPHTGGAPQKFSECYPEFVNRKFRIISGFFMGNSR